MNYEALKKQEQKEQQLVKKIDKVFKLMNLARRVKNNNK